MAVLLASALLLSVLRGHALAKDDFLPPEQAYRYATRVEGDQLIVTWTIEPGYYLYKKRMGVASTMAVGAARRTRLAARAKTTRTSISASRRSIAARSRSRCRSCVQGTRPPKLAIELKLQGCADAGLCYPPQKWQTEVACPPQPPASGGLTVVLPAPSRRPATTTFLPPDEAFRFGAERVQRRLDRR